jgi:hypothetical protein
MVVPASALQAMSAIAADASQLREVRFFAGLVWSVMAEVIPALMCTGFIQGLTVAVPPL